MEFRKLRYFAQAVEAKSISLAASALNVAQPALTKSIQALEAELDVKLLQRSTRGVIPTEAGEALYEHCQIIFRQVDRARIDVRKSTDKPSGHVLIGMPQSITAVLGVPLLQATACRFPDIQIEMTQDQTHVLSNRMRSGRIDFAVMASPRPNPDVGTEALLTEELFHVVPAGPELSQDPISFAAASTMRYVLPAVGNGLRASAEGHFRARSLPLNVSYEIDAIGMIPRCVEAGLGASLLPGGFLQQDQGFQRLRIRPLEGSCLRQIVIARSASSEPTPVAMSMMSLVRELSKAMVEGGGWMGGRLA